MAALLRLVKVLSSIYLHAPTFTFLNTVAHCFVRALSILAFFPGMYQCSFIYEYFCCCLLSYVKGHTCHLMVLHAITVTVIADGLNIHMFIYITHHTLVLLIHVFVWHVPGMFLARMISYVHLFVS